MASSSEPVQQGPFSQIPEGSPVGANPFAKNQRRDRIRTILITSGVLIALALGFFFYVQSRRSSIVIVGDTTNFTISVNGRSVQSRKTGDGLLIPIYSGLYRLKIERTDYLPFLTDVRVPAGKKVTIRPTFALLPTTTDSARNGIDYVHPAEDLRSIYYLGDSRQSLFRMEVPTQSDIKLTNTPLRTVSDVQWSSEPNVALLVQPDGIYLHEIPSFDFTTQTMLKVGSNEYLSPVWDPNDPNRIATAFFGTGGEKSLLLVNKIFTQIDRKVDLGAFTNPRLFWTADSRYVLVLNRSANADENNLWVFNLTDATFRQLTQSGGVLGVNSNPNGTTALIETLSGVSDPLQHHLAFIDISNGALTPLSITGTVSRAAWKSNSEMLIGVPGSNELTVVGVSGSQNGLGYTFPSSITIKGMWYFASSRTLIFTTDNAVYTISLDA